MNHDHPSPPTPLSPLLQSATAPPATTTAATDNTTATAATTVGTASPSPQRDIKASKLEDRQSKGRNRHAPFQTDALNEVFARTDHPTLQERTSLAKRLGMETKVVNSWFQNKRATLKKRAIREAAQSASAPPSERIEDSPSPPSTATTLTAVGNGHYGVIQPSPLKQAGSVGGPLTAHVLPPRNSHHHHPSSSLPPPPSPMEYAPHHPHHGHHHHGYRGHRVTSSSGSHGLPSLPPISSLFAPQYPPASPESESDVDDAASARSVHLAPIYDRVIPATPHAAYEPNYLVRGGVRAGGGYHPTHRPYGSYHHPHPHHAPYAHPLRRRSSLSPAPSYEGSARDRYASSQASSRSRSPPPPHARYLAYGEGGDGRSTHGWSEPEYEPASDPESDVLAGAGALRGVATAHVAAAAAAHAGKRKRGGVASATATGPAKTRQRLNARQVKELRDFYAHTTHPTRMEQEQLAEEIGLRVHSVTIWFQNQRSMDKRRRALGGATGSSDAIPAPPSRVSSTSDRPSPPPSSFASANATPTPLLHPPTSAARRGGSSTRPRRSRPEPAQLEALKRLYAVTTTPSIDQRARLAGEIGMETSKVTNWFRNLRQTAKKKRPHQGFVAHGLEGGMDVDDAEDEGMSEDDDDDEEEEEESAPPSRAGTPEEDYEEDVGAGEPMPLKRRRLSDEGVDGDVRMGEALHESDDEEEEIVTPPPSTVGRHHHHHHHHHHHGQQHHARAAPAASPALVPRTFGYEGRVQGKDVVAEAIPMRTSVAVEDAVLLLSLRGQA